MPSTSEDHSAEQHRVERTDASERRFRENDGRPLVSPCRSRRASTCRGPSCRKDRMNGWQA